MADHSYSVLSAEITGNEVSPQESVHLDSTICHFLKEQGVPGATLAVAKNGHIIYEQGYGVAGAGRRMKAGHFLRVASISKPITAIAILRLCEEGKLSLDTPVFGSKGVLKGLRAQGDKRLRRVTVRHLLQHAAGWDRDAAGDAVFWSVPRPPGLSVTSQKYNRHLLRYVLNRKLQFTPGSRHAYSNLGYLVLGEVIEAVTGQPYERYVQTLLRAIGLTRMRVGGEERAHWQSEEAEYFNIRGPSHLPSVLPGQPDSQVLPQYGSFAMRNTGPYGGWVGRARDVLNVLLNLEPPSQTARTPEEGHARKDLDPCHSQTSDPARQEDREAGKLLSARSVAAMLERPGYEEGHDWYGLGLDVQNRGASWGHTGAMEGTCGTVQRHHSGVAWCFLLNAWARDPDLDGAVKLALSGHPTLSPYPAELASSTREGLRVRTRDGAQIVATHVPPACAPQCLQEMEAAGFGLTWAGVNELQHDGKARATFNLTFSRAGGLVGRRWLLDVEVSELPDLIDLWVRESLQPEVVTTYLSDDRLLALVLLVRASMQDESREVVLSVQAEEYVKLLAQRRKCGHEVVSQCVTEVRGELLATAIMERTEVAPGLADAAFIRPAAPCKLARQKSCESESSSSSCFSSSSSSRTPSSWLSQICLESSGLPASSGHRVNNPTSRIMSPSLPPLPSPSSAAATTAPASRTRLPPLKTQSWVQMTPDSFTAALTRQARRGCGLRHVHFYRARGQSYVSGTWSPRCPRDCYQRMGVSYHGLLPALAEAAAADVRLRFLGQYLDDGVACYALFWDVPEATCTRVSQT